MRAHIVDTKKLGKEAQIIFDIITSFWQFTVPISIFLRNIRIICKLSYSKTHP
jgi:hypothetical protein